MRARCSTWVARQDGQSTVEWLGLLLLVAALLGGLLAAVGSGLQAGLFARAIAERLMCAAGIEPVCG